MKTGDKIIITKLGKFFELTGEIISNNELADKPLTVDLAPYGIWSFKLDECEPIGGDRKIIEAVGRQGLKNVIASLNKENETLDVKQKRVYKKRSDKPKEIKPKRKYVRKNADK